jgi:hypothetical protein
LSVDHRNKPTFEIQYHLLGNFNPDNHLTWHERNVSQRRQGLPKYGHCRRPSQSPPHAGARFFNCSDEQVSRNCSLVLNFDSFFGRQRRGFYRSHTHQSTRSIFGFTGRNQLFEKVRMIRSFHGMNVTLPRGTFLL